jgi:quercetin 2,3-dioxygenase
MHAEMPVDGMHCQGMQLWVDLPKELKSTEPRYRDLRGSEIPIATSPDGKTTVKVISGNSLGVESLKDLAYTPVWLLDVTIQPGGSLSQALPQNWNAFAYTLGGVTTFSNGEASETVVPYHNVVFAQAGDGINASVEEGAEEASRFILVAGQPLDQQVVQYGPFVTNSREEVMQALSDFQGSKNGFERGLNWQSEIAKGHF